MLTFPVPATSNDVGGVEQDAQAEIIFATILQHDAGAAKKIVWASAFVSRAEKLLGHNKDEEAKAQFALALQRDVGAAKKIDEAWVSTYVDRGGMLLEDGKEPRRSSRWRCSVIPPLPRGSTGLGPAPTSRAAISCSKRVRTMGEKLIATERELDREFASHTMTAARLRSLMAQIGEQQGELRAVHLKYHLTTAELLSDDQKQRYAEVRGYH